MLLPTISLLAGSVAAGAVLPAAERRQSFGFGFGLDLPFGSSSNQDSSNQGSSNQGNTTFPSSSGFNQASTHLSTGGNATCVSGYVPVTASTDDNLKLDISLPANQSQVTEFFVAEYSVGSTLAKNVVLSKATVSGTYNIYATLCTPLQNVKPKGVQLLTHGVGVSASHLRRRSLKRALLTSNSSPDHTGTLLQATATLTSPPNTATHLSSTTA